jgi:transcriptional regulator with XRE-family HTH domain
VTKDEAEFAARLDQALTRAGIPRGRGRTTKLANLFGVTRETARQWTLGRMPGVGTLKSLALRLSVTMDWLVTGRGALDAHLVAEKAAVYDVALVERELIERIRTLSFPRKQALLNLLNENL